MEAVIAIVVLALLIYLGVRSGGGAPARSSRKTAARKGAAKRPAARKAAKRPSRGKAKAKGRSRRR
jgi:hypothetical protein